ncbi:DUF308 domain-containing protein [Candidatus Saccharibacteria bacterium]|nr:DUF308 domain-containing protein [Candidatus Saccharibacteria bacterium]
MAHINRKYIDKHWTIFMVRGLLAGVFGLFTLFGGITDVNMVIPIISIFLLLIGIVDSVSALYSSTRKRGWINSVIDAAVDVVAAIVLLFFAKGNLVFSLVALSVYTLVSGLIDIFHGFLSTVDPTDRFIRVLVGVCGCVMGLVILNAGNFEIMSFIRFFGAYILIVGITSLIYGVHNRNQDIEDKVARKESRQKTSKKITRKSTAKKRK